METNILVHPADASAKDVPLSTVEPTLIGQRYFQREIYPGNASVSGFPQFHEWDFFVYLYGRIIQGWEIIDPILITIEPDNDSLIASETIFSVYGIGDTVSAAVQDYAISLI